MKLIQFIAVSVIALVIGANCRAASLNASNGLAAGKAASVLGRLFSNL